MVDNVAVVTISDTCSMEPEKDSSGPTLVELIQQSYPNVKIRQTIVPDDIETIKIALIDLCDKLKIDLIFTTGGTGLSKRDVTPEATKAIIDRDVPAISTAITIDSLKSTPMAMISRGISGVRNETLIINFPGSKKAVIECFNTVRPILSHAVSLIKNELNEVKSTHKSIQGSDHVCPHMQVTTNILDNYRVAFRPRESPYPMIEMPEAFRLIDEILNNYTLDYEVIGIEEALGRVLGEEVVAKEALPPFPASVKDGYACISLDGTGTRRVRSVLAAGDTPDAPLLPGECARINTGAAVPPGADCVVQVEYTMLVNASKDGRSELEVDILVAPEPNQDIRPIGADIELGSVLAYEGAILDAAMIGVLAGAGVQTVKVTTQPKVALLSTGNELQEPSEGELKPSHVRDSNRTMLRSLLREHGYDSIDFGIARDDPNELVNAISRAFTKADILVCTGGVSMGERDLLKPVLLEEFQASLHFGRVRMKPGKPSTFATCNFNGRKKYVFALPGNPVSAYVCCLLFVVRALQISSGRRVGWMTIRVELSHDVSLDPRPEYARATLERGAGDLPKATLIGSQASSRLLSACGARVLLELPAGGQRAGLKAGTIVTALVTSKLEY